MKKSILLKIVLVFALIVSVFVPVDIERTEAASKTYSATVNVKELDVRDKASSKAKKLGTLKKGAKVTVYTKSDWSKIKYNKKYAYVLTKSLKFNIITAKNAYKKMIALKKKYPEGMTWTNDNYYSGGYGCAGFAFILSDKAFGNLPAREHTNFDNIKVGDIIRVDNDTHSVVILSIDKTTVTLAEGNYNSSIHWGRVLTLKQLKETGDYIMTRYPK